MSLIKRTIRRSNSEYLKELYVKDRKETSYDKNRLSVGKSFNTRPFYLDLSEGVRIVFLGIVGAGKSFSTRALIDRIYSTGKYHVLYLGDSKNEYLSSRFPAPKSQGDFYAPGEVAKGMPVVAIRPNYFKYYKLPIPENNYGFGFRITDLSENDWKELIDFNKLPALQKAMMHKMIMGLIRNPKEFKSVQDIKDYIENSKLDRSSKVNMELKLYHILESRFFSEPYINVVDMLQKDYMVTLNLEFFDRIDKGSGLPQITVSILRRMVSNARKKGLLKKRVMIVIDEASRFVPASRDTGCKEDILEAVEVERRYRIDYIFAYQTVEDIPPKILQNSKYVFLPSNASQNVFVDMYKSFGSFSGASISLRPRINKVLGVMRRVRYSWLCFDRAESSPIPLVFWNPLSYHTKSN